MGDVIWSAILSSKPVQWLIGAVVTVLAFLGIIAAARRDAAQDARAEAENTNARDYAAKRREIDNADLGIGASDADRIKRLRTIADGERSGGD